MQTNLLAALLNSTLRLTRSLTVEAVGDVSLLLAEELVEEVRLILAAIRVSTTLLLVVALRAKTTATRVESTTIVFMANILIYLKTNRRNIQ